jgi:hypothetical protein
MPKQWRCREGRNGEFTIGHESGGFAPIARVKGDKRSTLKDAKENAHLMAAAPELLVALRAMMDHCYDPDRNDAIVEAFNLARDAIAKAEDHPCPPKEVVCMHEEVFVKGSLVHCKKCDRCFGID